MIKVLSLPPTSVLLVPLKEEVIGKMGEKHKYVAKHGVMITNK